MQFDQISHFWVVVMRLYSSLLLVTSALSLAACAGGGGGGDFLTTSSLRAGVGSACPITPVDGTPDPSCVDGNGGTTTPPPTPEPDGDGDGIADDDDEDGSTGSGAGGNTSDIAVGNRAIVLKKFVLDKPTSGTTALVTVNAPSLNQQAATDALILSATKPVHLTHRVDTNSEINGELSVPVMQNHYLHGTRDLDWIALRHHNFPRGTAVGLISGSSYEVDGSGQPIYYAGYPILESAPGVRNIVIDPSDRKFKFATVNTNPDPDNDPDTPPPDWIYGAAVDPTQDTYWNQLHPFMNAKANGGAGTDYREYRVLSETDNRDELLQVWSFGESYAMQYQNAAGGGLPKHQAWSYGGNKATSMPTGGSAVFNGRWVGTAETRNWLVPDDADINPNALWRVEGNSNFNVNYTTNSLTGTLTPETWSSFQESGLYTWFSSASGYKKPGTALEPDYSIIYETTIGINANFDAAATPGGLRNTFTGEANLSGTYITGDNPVYGGFFGTNGAELTGVFNTAGVHPTPQGGSQGVNDSRRGNLSINGAFHGDCTPDPAAPSTCTITP